LSTIEADAVVVDPRGDRGPERWLEVARRVRDQHLPALRNPGSARTDASRRGDVLTVMTTPSSSSVAAKHTSRPPAKRIAARMATAAVELSRVAGSAAAWEGIARNLAYVLSGFFFAAGNKTLFRMSR
jgi:hypothetical protein